MASVTYSIILAVHIAGACITALVGAYALAMLWRREEGKYSLSASVLGFVAGFEVVTGTLLSVLSLQVTALSLCANIAAYLAIVLFLEAALFVRMKKISIRFPAASVFSPIAASFLGMAGAVLHGF